MLRAARWRTAGGADDVAAACGFGGANEGADKFAVDEWGDFFDVEAGGSEKIASFLDFVNASGLDVDGVVRQRNVLNGALEEFEVFDAGFFLIFACEREHFVGHVQTVRFACGADALCGEDNVDAAARAEIEYDFAGLKLREGSRIAAAERGSDGFFRECGLLGIVVEIVGDGVAAAELCATSTARRAAAGSALGGFAVFLFHGFLDGWFAHG